nr:MAG TPA: hypothetical protein [Siphoviridae sp. ctfdk3]
MSGHREFESRPSHLLFNDCGVTASWSATAAKSAKADANSKKTARNSSSNARANTVHAGSAECPSTTTHRRTPQTTASTSTTSIPSPNDQTCNTTPQASAHHTHNATTCAATKTQPHQSAHSADNGSKQHRSNTIMDIDEPVKTACGQTLREATGTITLHISASLSADNVSYDLASVDADLPITVEVVNNNGTIMPKVDSVGFTRILTAGINAFTNAIKA